MNHIGINGGHVDSDSGAVNKNAREVDITKTVALVVEEELERSGFKVTSCNGSLRSITDKANRNRVDFLLSIHCNAGGGDGFGAYIHKLGTESEQIANSIVQQVVYDDKLNNPHGNPVKIQNLHVTRESNMPAVLLEIGFMDTSDYECFNEFREQKAFGVSIAKGILKHYKCKYCGK